MTLRKRPAGRRSRPGDAGQPPPRSLPVRWFLLWGPLVGYMGVIFAMSSTPRPTLLSYAPDYAWHFTGYFALGLLAVRAFGGGLPLVKAGAAWSALGWSSIYAASDEWHQSFVPGRVASMGDFTVDCLGIVLAVGLAFGYTRLRTATGPTALKPWGPWRDEA